nr:ulp1 protease family, C-terminal catalytic domain-containing protein [Tanacetum cinerariifolium]
LKFLLSKQDAKPRLIRWVLGLILKEKGADPLIVVLGPEHGGRTRTVGDGIDAERDAARDAARDAEIEVECENVEREASNEGGLQKRRKQSSCELKTVVHGDKEKLKDIKEPKSCFLFSPYTEDTTPIARGMVYPICDGTIHGGPVIPYYMKVSIDSFVPAFIDSKLPVVSKADDTITLLEQSVGSFFQWPRCRISCTLNTPTLKDKASQSKAATLQPTLATPIPVVEETTLLMSALQTPVLLETEQAEASLPLEDVRQAKKELDKKLDDFEHIVFRKQPCVKDAYLRWTTRNDDTADHIFEVPGGMIVGHEDTFHGAMQNVAVKKRQPLRVFEPLFY